MARAHVTWPIAAALILAISFPFSALASPWTVPDDELSLMLSYDYQFASDEYLLDGTRQSFPLEGEFASSNINLGGRYGFSDRFEGFFSLSFKQASYSSRPFLPELRAEEEGGEPAIGSTRDAIVNFSDTSVGAGDLFFGGRYNLRSGAFVMALEGQAKLPTGYDDPTGTTITRGDGQIDLQPSFLSGLYIPQTASFARIDAGYNLRFGGPGHQAVGAFRVGQFLGERVILLAGVSGAYTLFQGDAVEGESNFVAIDPDKPFAQFGEDDFRVEPFYLDKSFARAEVGLITRLQKLELQFAYSYMFAGANIPVLQGLSVSSVVTLPQVTKPRAESSEPTQDGEIIEEVIVEEIVPAEEDEEGEPGATPREEEGPGSGGEPEPGPLDREI